jgi:hypothetical protein
MRWCHVSDKTKAKATADADEEEEKGPPTLEEQLKAAAESEERIVRSIFHPDMSEMMHVWNPATDERHTLIGDQREIVFESYLKPKGFRRVGTTDPIPEGALNRENPSPIDPTMVINATDPPDAAQAEAAMIKAAAAAAKAQEKKS